MTAHPPPLLVLALRWLVGDAVRVPSRRVAIAIGGLGVVALAYSASSAWHTVAPLYRAEQPALPPDRGDVRFGVPLQVRREIFSLLAAAEPSAREKGAQSFPGPALEWSAEDHRGAFERKEVAALAAKYRLSLTQVYLILDEGIRNRWPGPDSLPLNPKTVPLNPRRKYGW